MRNFLFITFSFIVLGFLNYEIFKKEDLLKRGDIVLLKLAPVDPRSLLQGDYMRFSYELEREAKIENAEASNDKKVVLTLDDDRIGKYSRPVSKDSLGPNEKLFNIRYDNGRIQIYPDSYLFQEGLQQLYSKAKYGIFRVDSTGEHLLVGLAGEDKKEIQPVEEK